MVLRDLFKPAWQSKNSNISKEAVTKITDEKTLVRIAKEAQCWAARKDAVEKLDEQHQILFAEIAKNDDCTVVADYVDTDARIANVSVVAVNKLTDMVLLADVAKNSIHSLVRFKAENKLKKLEELQKLEELRYKSSTFDEKKSLKLVSDYIDANPMQKLSKEEMEMMKPFFAELFMWYKNNTEGKSLSNECSRCDCHISDDNLIFLSGSGRLFCKDCALQYVISNLSDWHYYLGDIAVGIGFVPLSIQKKGLELQEKMNKERAGIDFKKIKHINKNNKFSSKQTLSLLMQNQFH